MAGRSGCPGSWLAASSTELTTTPNPTTKPSGQSPRLPQPRQHVPGDLFDLRVSSSQPVSPVGRPRRQHRRARVVRVGTQHRVAVTYAFHRLGVAGPEHAERDVLQLARLAGFGRTRRGLAREVLRRARAEDLEGRRGDVL